MTVAHAVDTGAHTFSGPVAHELMQHTGGNNLKAAAHMIAAHFMANMDSDVFHHDHAHNANLSAKAGLSNASHNFTFASVGGDFKAPKAAPDASDKNTGVAQR